MAPAAITSIEALAHEIEGTFSHVLRLDGAEGTMTFQARSDGLLCSTRGHLVSGFTVAGGEITLDNVDDVIQVVMPSVGVNADKRLQRVNPMQHPYRGQRLISGTRYDMYKLYAQQIEVVPQGYGETDSSGGITRQQVAYNGATRLNSPAYVRPPFHEYVVTFRPIDYPLLGNNDVADVELDTDNGGYTGKAEWTRNTRIRSLPYIDTLTLEGGQLQFAENADPGIARGITFKGQAFPAPIHLNEVKSILKISWLDVPADFVMSAQAGKEGRFLQFEKCMGKVNSETFLGRTMDTLLMKESPEFVSKAYGVFNRTLRTFYVNEWLYDIHINLIEFHPKLGNSVSDGDGHNVFPPKGQNFYLFATRPPANQGADNPNNPGIENNPPLYTREDFRWMFQWVDAV